MSDKTINVSNHCMERYAERIMNKSEKIDINIYVAQNKDKIIERVNKMYQFGKKVYEGKTSGKQSVEVCVFVSPPWILLTDKGETNAITLYKSEIVSEDNEEDKKINNMFVQSRLDKLYRIKDDIDKAVALKRESDKKIREDIEGYNELINYYKDLYNKYLNKLKIAEEMLKDDTKIIELNEKYRMIIEELVGKKILKR